jgi:hypothetical protein
MALPEEVKKRRAPIVITLSPRAEDLLRAQNRRKGDMSRIVEELILAKYAAPST